VVSLMRAPLFAHRFLIICLPPFVLLVTRGLTSLRTQWVIPVFVVLCGITVGVSYTQPREDWRGATRYVLAHAQRGDAIYFFQPYGKMPFEYYVQHSHGEIHPASLTRDAITPSSGYGRLWVVLYPAVKPDASTLGVQAGFAAQYPLLEEADQFRAVRLLLFDLRRAK